jgi:hypothetical protein
MKKTWLCATAMCCALFASVANAVPRTYDITISGGSWVNIGSSLLGLSGQPTLNGWVTVDSAFTGLAAFQDLSLTTGAHTWTLTEFVGPTATALFDSNDELALFSLGNFQANGTSMYLYSFNTVAIFNQDDWFFCNQCVSFKAGAARAVNEPATLALLGLGIIWLGIRLSRDKK